MTRRLAVTGVALAVVVMSLAVSAFVLLLRHSADQDRVISKLASSLEVTRQQIETFGQIPAAPPAQDIVEGVAGPTGPPGRPPTPEEVAAAVTEYLTAHPPAPGRPPTADEVANAVAAFCADGRCTGANGADGSPPSDAQTAAAVQNYCNAHNQCQGAPGGQGPPGPAGKDGQTPQSFTFTFLAHEYVCTDPDRDGAYTCT